MTCSRVTHGNEAFVRQCRMNVRQDSTSPARREAVAGRPEAAPGVRSCPNLRNAAGSKLMTDTSTTIKNHAAFIWSVADLLRGDYKQSEYGKVILPLTVLRQFDCVLEPVKQKMLDTYARIEGRVENFGPVLDELTDMTGLGGTRPPAAGNDLPVRAHPRRGGEDRRGLQATRRRAHRRTGPDRDHHHPEVPVRDEARREAEGPP